MSYTTNDNLKIIEQSPLSNKYTDIQEVYNGDIDNTDANFEVDVNKFSMVGVFVDISTIGNAEGVKLNVYFRTESGGSNYLREIHELTEDTNTQKYIPIECRTAKYVYFDIQADTPDTSTPSAITVKINKKYI